MDVCIFNTHNSIKPVTLIYNLYVNAFECTPIQGAFLITSNCPIWSYQRCTSHLHSTFMGVSVLILLDMNFLSYIYSLALFHGNNVSMMANPKSYRATLMQLISMHLLLEVHVTKSGDLKYHLHNSYFFLQQHLCCE